MKNNFLIVAIIFLATTLYETKTAPRTVYNFSASYTTKRGHTKISEEEQKSLLLVKFMKIFAWFVKMMLHNNETAVVKQYAEYLIDDVVAIAQIATLTTRNQPNPKIIIDPEDPEKGD